MINTNLRGVSRAAMFALLLCYGCAPSGGAGYSTASGRTPAPGPNEMNQDNLLVCVIDGDSLALVRAAITPQTGDTFVGGIRFSEKFPTTSPPYATGSSWFLRGESILFEGRRYHGGNHPPQIIEPDLLHRIGSHRGVPMFAEAGDTIPTIIYIPVAPRCVFQSYIGIQTRASSEESPPPSPSEE